MAIRLGRERPRIAAALAVLCAGACGGGEAAKQPAEAPVVMVGGVGEGAREKEPTPQEATSPGASAPRGERRFEGKIEPPLKLTVTVTLDGVLFSTSSGPVAPGCLRLGGDGVTVPSRDGALDTKGISECAQRIKRARPEFAEESQVTITAEPSIQYRTVVELIDALRGDGDEPLFPEVTFGVKR